ncbi:hypothetical protein RPAGB_0508 [Rickettsia parkeri str. Grand Bay]|nr:hypothetical protein RPAGB_0508 [Rickettsia parkeri str. Grand Bay]
MQDMIKLWEKFLTEFKHIIILDKEKGYIDLRSFLWYTNTKTTGISRSIGYTSITAR